MTSTSEPSDAEGPRIALSSDAAALIAAVRREYGNEIALVISDGCCDGTAPMVVHRSLVSQANDVQLGEAAGLRMHFTLAVSRGDAVRQRCSVR